MEGVPDPGSGGPIKRGVTAGWIWIALFVFLLLWHGWMTLSLFGPDNQWQRLFDDQPIVSGRHPLHLYHGYLGARSFRERGTLLCYDPAFQAGYPKTPVFDGGSRPAELFLSLAGARYRPAAYKLGLAICCLSVPFLFLMAARGAGLCRSASFLATLFALLVWWGAPCRQLLEGGDLDFLLGGLGAVAAAGMLVRFQRAPGVYSWVGLLGSSGLAWFGYPPLVAALVPLFLVYYFSVGTKHRVAWHVALLSSLLGGVVLNGFWLFDWFSYWWLRSPLRADVSLLTHRTFRTFWAAPLWGDDSDRLLGLVLLAGAAIGVWILNETSQRTAARLLGLGACGSLIAALAGVAYEPLGQIGTPRLFIPALWFAVLPAAHAAAQCLFLAIRATGGPWRGAAVMGVILASAVFFAPETAKSLAVKCTATTPLALGLASRYQALLEAVVTHTTKDARILWEDRSAPECASRWSALLPLLTERAYLGGLDPEAGIEHAYAGFVEQNLAGRPIGSWSDADLEAFCQRYNVGWAMCRSPAAIARFRSWRGAEPLAAVGTEPAAVLYRMRPRSFVLKGKARLLHSDFRHIALADLVPEEDQVVLSMHYQAGLRASPARVHIEQEPDPYDPIPFIRLRMSGPIARVTLTWQDK
jgi:hypothetical protein